MADRTKRILRQHVKTDQLLGVDAVPQRKRKPAAPATATATANATAKAPVASVVGSGPAVPQGVAPIKTAASRPGKAADRLAVLEKLDKSQVQSCTRCSLCEGRTQTVFGEGNITAKLMFVGEGPGQNEDEQGRPFVGRAGQLLDKQIEAMKLKREQVYIANTVKCRPPQNRPPTPDEVAACFPFLLEQIRMIQPKVIVVLGASAAKTLLNVTTGISLLRGNWQQFDGLRPDGPSIPVMPTFHPSYLLRVYTPENRRKVWDDLKKVIEKLG